MKDTGQSRSSESIESRFSRRFWGVLGWLKGRPVLSSILAITVIGSIGTALTSGELEVSSSATDPKVALETAGAGAGAVDQLSKKTIVSTTSGMKYELVMKVETMTAKRIDEAPNRSRVEVEIPGSLTIRNMTEDFTADIDVNELNASIFLPSLSFDIANDLELYINGVGKEARLIVCNGFLELEEFTLDPLAEKECGGSANIVLDDLTSEQASEAVASLDGVPPLAIVLQSYGIDWAVPDESNEDEIVKVDRSDQCGYLIGQWVAGGPFCGEGNTLKHDQGTGNSFGQIVGSQPRPVLTIVEVEKDSTSIVIQAKSDYFETADVSLDLVEEIPDECVATRKKSEIAVSNLWRPNQSIQFIISDPDWRSGIAFPAEVDVSKDPKSINEELVEKGLWVPSGLFANSKFDPRKRVSQRNLPYVLPNPIPDDWSFIRAHYAGRIVDLGNAAALKTSDALASDCYLEIRQILLDDDEAADQYRLDIERDRNSRGSGGGSSSFNIPGWLCPTRWC
jgi:hypothetical protein